MAIEKRFIHFKRFSDFNSKKLSANEANTQYTVGVSGAIQNGDPDILYQSYVWIKDTKQQWTHGQLYDGSKSDTPFNETDPIFSASPAASITEAKKTEWNSKYAKPSGGIPKSDLASAVQTSLGKADTALQSYTEQYKGTVTGVKVNGSTKSPSSGTVDIGSVATSVKINGKSKSPSSGVVDLGYINKQLSTSTSSSMVIRPNMYYRNTSTSLSSLTITLYKEDVNGILNEYFVEFTTSNSGTTVSFPSSVKWANGTQPTFEAGCTYQVSIVNNLGTWVKFK